MFDRTCVLSSMHALVCLHARVSQGVCLSPSVRPSFGPSVCLSVRVHVRASKCLFVHAHVSNICTKANRTLGFLRRNLSACPQDVKESAYKGLVRPVLEYGSSVWDPSSILLQEELEKVQKRAARFVTGNYLYETGSMTGILEQLKWESLKKRRRDSRIIMLYKGLKGAASIPTNDLVPPIRHVRNHHSLAFQTPFANTDIYKCSFFPQTIRDWNSLTDTFLSAAEGAEDSVAKFTSLVRARD